MYMYRYVKIHIHCLSICICIYIHCILPIAYGRLSKPVEHDGPRGCPPMLGAAPSDPKRIVKALPTNAKLPECGHKAVVSEVHPKAFSTMAKQSSAVQQAPPLSAGPKSGQKSAVPETGLAPLAEADPSLVATRSPPPKADPRRAVPACTTRAPAKFPLVANAADARTIPDSRPMDLENKRDRGSFGPLCKSRLMNM